MVAKLLVLCSDDLSFYSISLIVQLFLTTIFLSASTAVNTSSKLSKSLDFQNFEKFNATPQEIAPNFYAQTQFLSERRIAVSNWFQACSVISCAERWMEYKY